MKGDFWLTIITIIMITFISILTITYKSIPDYNMILLTFFPFRDLRNFLRFRGDFILQQKYTLEKNRNPIHYWKSILNALQSTQKRIFNIHFSIGCNFANQSYWFCTLLPQTPTHQRGKRLKLNKKSWFFLHISLFMSLSVFVKV